MKKINWRKLILSAAVLVLVGLIWPNLTQGPAITLVNRMVPTTPILFPYVVLAGMLVSLFWGLFWFAVSDGIVLTFWARLETLQPWMALVLFLVTLSIIAPPLSVGLALGIVIGLAGRAVFSRLAAWART